MSPPDTHVVSHDGYRSAVQFRAVRRGGIPGIEVSDDPLPASVSEVVRPRPDDRIPDRRAVLAPMLGGWRRLGYTWWASMSLRAWCSTSRKRLRPKA